MKITDFIKLELAESIYSSKIENWWIWKLSFLSPPILNSFFKKKIKNPLNLSKRNVWIKYLPGQGCILQLFWSFADPAQTPPELSTLRFVLVRDSIPASQVVEHDDQLDQEFHSQSTGNMQFHVMGVKCSYFWFAKHIH